jgi:hypothetical protein
MSKKNSTQHSAGNTMKPSLNDFTVEYDVITYQINQHVIKSGVIHKHCLVWDIPTWEQARLILAKLNIKSANIYQRVNHYGSDQEAQERRISSLADTGMMTSIDLAQPASKESGGVAL